jgi:hypothetical protein
MVDVVQVSGPRLHQVSGGTTAIRSFLATAPGMVELDVSTTDGQRFSLPERVRIHVRSANNAPVSVVFTQLATSAGASFTFDFSQSSDIDSDPFTVVVIQTGGPVAGELTAVDDLTTSFSASLAGTYTFEALAHDGIQFSEPYAFTVIHAPAGSGLPVATPELLSLSASGAVATLSATNASDPDGDPLGFLWVQSAGPAAVVADNQAQTTAVDLIPGTADYAFDLYVDDGINQTKAGTVTFTSTGIPGGPAAGGDGGGGCAAIAGSGRVWMPFAAAALAMLGLVVIRRRRSVKA